MRTLLSMGLLAALATQAGCGERAPPAATSKALPAATPADEAGATPPATPASTDPGGEGSLRVKVPAESAITFQGFGPAKFGATVEAMRMAWGGDLGDATPSEPGGCFYLMPQPIGASGYRNAFMIEGDRFVRMDVRRADVAAPGGGKAGMTKAQLAALYPAIEQQPHKYTDGLYLRIKDPAGSNGVLVFEIDGKGDQAKVTEWRIGLPPQVDYVEGCS